MSRYYARITESARRTIPTARGHNGVTVWAQSWEGSVCTEVRDDQGRAHYTVTLHKGSGGEYVRTLASGYCDEADQ